MPQTSPMNWMTISLCTIVLMNMLMSNFTMSVENTKKKSKLKIKKNILWKW